MLKTIAFFVGGVIIGAVGTLTVLGSKKIIDNIFSGLPKVAKKKDNDVGDPDVLKPGDVEPEKVPDAVETDMDEVPLAVETNMEEIPPASESAIPQEEKKEKANEQK